MKRRQFLKGLMSAPVLAFPSIAVSAIALHESNSAYRRIDQAIKGDNIQIVDSIFNLNGGLEIHGNQATINGCNIQMVDNGQPAISYKTKAPHDLDSTYSNFSLK